jgi:hypothetical protein
MDQYRRIALTVPQTTTKPSNINTVFDSLAIISLAVPTSLAPLIAGKRFDPPRQLLLEQNAVNCAVF